MAKLIWVFVALFPFLVWPWGKHMDVFLPKAEYMTLITLCLWGGFLWLVLKHKFRPRLHTAHWLLLGLAALVTAATVFSVDPVLSLTGMQGRNEGMWAWYCYISLFFFSSFFFSKDNYVRVMQTFVFGGWLVSIYGILQHFHLDFLPRSFYHVDYYRSWGFFDNPNYFGSYLVLVLMAGTALYMATSAEKLLGALYMANITSFAAMVYSGSRAAWLTVAFGLIVYAWLVRKVINWQRYWLLMASFALVFMVIILSEQGRYLPRFVSLFIDPLKAFAGDGSAGAGRWSIWTRAVPLIKDYFWLGSGPDTFHLVFPGNVHNAHNVYLQLAITMGVPAALTYMAGIFVVLNKGFSKIRAMTEPKTLILRHGLLAVCYAYSAKMLFNTSVIVVAPFFWILLGICYQLALEPEQPTAMAEQT